VPSADLEHAREIDSTVTGRRSGREITNPVWFVQAGGRQALPPPRPRSDRQWYRNVRKSPTIRVAANGTELTAQATPVTDPAHVQDVEQKFRAKYGDADVERYPKRHVTPAASRPRRSHFSAAANSDRSRCPRHARRPRRPCDDGQFARIGVAQPRSRERLSRERIPHARTPPARGHVHALRARVRSERRCRAFRGSRPTVWQRSVRRPASPHERVRPFPRRHRRPARLQAARTAPLRRPPHRRRRGSLSRSSRRSPPPPPAQRRLPLTTGAEPKSVPVGSHRPLRPGSAAAIVLWGILAALEIQASQRGNAASS